MISPRALLVTETGNRTIVSRSREYGSLESPSRLAATGAQSRGAWSDRASRARIDDEASAEEST